MKLIKDGVLQVKMDDVIQFRNGKEEKVTSVYWTRDSNLNNRYPVTINYDTYTENGTAFHNEENDEDIVTIIPAISPQSEPGEFFGKVGKARGYVNVSPMGFMSAIYETLNEAFSERNDTDVTIFVQGTEGEEPV